MGDGAGATWRAGDGRRPVGRERAEASDSASVVRSGREPDRDFYLAFNAGRETLPFAIPPGAQERPWRRAVDTALASPLDVVGLDEGPQVPSGSKYAVAPFSLIVLIGEA